MGEQPRFSVSSPPPRPEFTVLHALIWILGAFLLMASSVVLLYSARAELGRDLVTLGGVSSAVFFFVSALLLGKYPGGSRLLLAVGARRTQPVLVLLGFVVGVVCQVPAERVSRLVERFFPLSPEELAARAEMLQPTSSAHAAALALVAALLVPIAEETFFRGAVYGALRRSGRSGLLSAGVTSLGFTLSHDVRFWLPIAFVAALLGFLRAASGSLLPCLALHVGFNGLTVLGAITGWGSAADEVPLRVELCAWGLVAVLVAVSGLLARSDAARGARRAEESIHA